LKRLQVVGFEGV